MEAILIRVKERGTPPTRQDVADVLRNFGDPGQNQPAKEAAVRRLYEVTGHQAHNFQGHPVTDILDSFQEW